MQDRIHAPRDVVPLHVVEFGFEAGVALDGGFVLGAIGVFGEVVGGRVELAFDLVDFLEDLGDLMVEGFFRVEGGNLGDIGELAGFGDGDLAVVGLFDAGENF